MNRDFGAGLVRRLGVILLGAATLVAGCGGINGGVVLAPLTGTGGRAFVDAGDSVKYSEVFENGFGFGASVILRRPAAGTVSLGDTYLLAGGEFVSFGGRPYAGGVDDASIMSGWLEAKTMLEPLGVSGKWKPYVQAGLGIVRMPEVTYALGQVYEASFEIGLRGKLGIEMRSGKLGFYADIGVQLTTAPNVVNPALGSGESMVYTPIGAGIVFSF